MKIKMQNNCHSQAVHNQDAQKLQELSTSSSADIRQKVDIGFIENYFIHKRIFYQEWYFPRGCGVKVELEFIRIVSLVANETCHRTPLHIALEMCQNGQTTTSFVERVYVMEQTQLRIVHQDCQMTPYHWVNCIRYITQIEPLLAFCTFQRAKTGNSEVLQLLLHCGIYKSDVRAKTKSGGWTPLHLAAKLVPHLT